MLLKTNSITVPNKCLLTTARPHPNLSSIKTFDLQKHQQLFQTGLGVVNFTRNGDNSGYRNNNTKQGGIYNYNFFVGQ